FFLSGAPAGQTAGHTTALASLRRSLILAGTAYPGGAMLQLQTLSTDGLPPGERLEFWNEVACQTLALQCAEPLRPQSCSGRMRRADCGTLRMIEFSSDAATVVRSHAH